MPNSHSLLEMERYSIPVFGHVLFIFEVALEEIRQPAKQLFLRIIRAINICLPFKPYSLEAGFSEMQIAEGY